MTNFGTCYEIDLDNSNRYRSVNSTGQDLADDANLKRIHRRFSPLEDDMIIIHKDNMPIPDNQIFTNEASASIADTRFKSATRGCKSVSSRPNFAIRAVTVFPVGINMAPDIVTAASASVTLMNLARKLDNVHSFGCSRLLTVNLCVMSGR
ncbi:hypothetical protein Ddc_17068 [Ditylenchus destructor]|nr:hypothetical protein Ddc_17068 [Ditylenchus destructor]